MEIDGTHAPPVARGRRQDRAPRHHPRREAHRGVLRPGGEVRSGSVTAWRRRLLWAWALLALAWIAGVAYVCLAMWPSMPLDISANDPATRAGVRSCGARAYAVRCTGLGPHAAAGLLLAVGWLDSRVDARRGRERTETPPVDRRGGGAGCPGCCCLLGRAAAGGRTVWRWRRALTLTWPRTQAVILDARIDLRETTSTVPGTDKYRGGRTETRETATFHVRYRYRVDGQDYEAMASSPPISACRTRPPRASWGAAYQPGRRWWLPTTRVIRRARICGPAPVRRP